MTAKMRNATAGDRGVSEFVHGLNCSANSRNRNALQEPRGEWPLWIYCGQEETGRIYTGPDGFGTFSAAGDYLGTFGTLPAARAAVWDHRQAQSAPRMAA